MDQELAHCSSHPAADDNTHAHDRRNKARSPTSAPTISSARRAWSRVLTETSSRTLLTATPGKVAPVLDVDDVPAHLADHLGDLGEHSRAVGQLDRRGARAGPIAQRGPEHDESMRERRCLPPPGRRPRCPWNRLGCSSRAASPAAPAPSSIVFSISARERDRSLDLLFADYHQIVDERATISGSSGRARRRRSPRRSSRRDGAPPRARDVCSMPCVAFGLCADIRRRETPDFDRDPIPDTRPPPPTGTTTVSTSGPHRGAPGRPCPARRSARTSVERRHEVGRRFRRRSARPRQGARRSRSPRARPSRRVPRCSRHLRERRTGRHHDRRRHPEPVRVVGETLRVVARRCGHHARWPAPRGKASSRSRGPSFLERGGELEVLEFQQDARAGDVGERLVSGPSASRPTAPATTPAAASMSAGVTGRSIDATSIRAILPDGPAPVSPMPRRRSRRRRAGAGVTIWRQPRPANAMYPPFPGRTYVPAPACWSFRCVAGAGNNSSVDLRYGDRRVPAQSLQGHKDVRTLPSSGPAPCTP